MKYIDTVYGVNGLSPYQYKAVGGGLPAAAGSFGAPTPTFTVYTVAGGTPVTYTIKDAGGCLQDTTINRPSVLALGAPNLSASASPPCFNQFSLDSISVISQAGGIGPYSFVCSPTFAGTIFLPTPANPTKWKNLVFPGLGTVFTVTVTDALGCTKTGVKNLVNPTLLVMPTPSVTNPTCFGDSTGKLCFSTATTGTPLYTYSVVPSIPSIIFTTVPTNCFNNLPAGTFTMTVTDANGCTATTTKTLSQPAVITINTSAATILAPTCPNNCNGTYQPIATGGTGGKKFYKFPFVGPGQWDYSDSVVTPITTNKFLNLCAGTYTILAKDALGCTATTTVTLSLPPIPVMNIGTITPVACFGGTGTIPVTITNGTTPYTAASYSYQPGPISGMTVSSGGPGGTIGSYSNVPAGSYNLIIMNANGCSDTVFNVVMTQPAAPVTYSLVVVDSVLCFGTATGTITAQATGGTLGVNSYQYAIKFGAAPFSAFSAATLAPYAFTNLVAGTYTIRVRDHNLCTKDSVVIVRQPTKLNLLLDDIDATCFGTSNGEICVIDTGGTPGYQYKLGIAGAYSAAQPSGTNFCYGGLAAGTYSIFTMDAKGCLDTLTATVASIPLPIVSFTASPNDTVCNGTAITLCGTGADTYLWTGGIFDCTAFTTTLGAHQYIVTGTNTTTGCSNKDTVDVLINPIPVLTDPADQVRCNNTATALVNFVSSVAGSTFSWVNSDPSIGLAASGSGNNIPPFLAQNTTNLPVVATITVTATGPAPDFCVSPTQSFTITVNPDAFIALTSPVGTNTQTLCINDVLTDITYAVSGGGTNATVSATLPAGVFGSFSAGVFTISGSPTGPAGVYPYTLTTSGTCLQTTATGTITVSPDATLALSSAAGTNAQTLCINTPLTNINYTVGGTGTFGSVAGLPNGVNGNFAGGVVTISGSPSVSGLFTYTVTATGTCASTTTTGMINVTPLQNPAFSYPSSTYCQTGVNPSAVITGTPGGTFSYTGPGTLQLNATTGFVTLATSNLGTYTIKYLTAGPCPDSSTFLFTITLAPTAGFTYASASYCQNGTDPLPTFAAGASAGVFSSLPNTLTFVSTGTGQIDLSASAAGTYTVTNFIAAAGGCAAASASTVVTIDSTTILTDPSDQVRCNNTATAAVNFVSTVAGSTYSWVNNTPSIGLAASGSGNIAPFLAQNTGTTPVVATITVTPAGPVPDFCAGLPQTFTITVNPDAYIALTSGVGSNTPTLCINDVLTDITYAVTGGGTGATVSALPAGLFGSFSAGVFTISGSPTGPSGVYTYTVTTTGTCAQATSTGTINISPDATLTLTSAAGTNAQTVCINTSITNIKYTVGGTGNFASVAGLPASVNGVFAGGVLTISGSPSVSGLYTYTVTATGTCASTTTTGTINVTPLQDPSFSYALSTYCQTGVDPLAIITGTPGGSFSATPIGLSINVTTGLIDLSLSGANTYTVKYLTNGPCPDSSTFAITIIAPPTAGFSYSPASYCQSGVDPLPVMNAGASSGVFSSTAGLSINSATGLIDLSASASGTYIVTNFIAAANGCASVSATTNVTIDSTTILTDPADQVRCNNSATAAVNFVSTVAGSTYSWVNNTPSIGLAANGTGNIAPFLAQNSSNVPVVATITVTPTGPAPNFCDGLPQSFTITVNPDAFISLTSASGTDAQTLCINDVLADITYQVDGGGTGAVVSALPAGLFGTFAGGVFTISGSPTGPSGVYTYTVTTTGTCAQATATGTITISPDATLALGSAAGTDAQTLCINTTLINIKYNVGGTGNFASAAGLPAGVTDIYAGGVLTINGTPSVSGLYTYTITASGTCASVTTTGTIDVTPLQDPAFSYALSTYCQTGANPSPTITGTPGGTFSATPAGLSINSATGQIILTTSTLGTYDVQYVTNGPCPDSSTFNVTITTAPTTGFSYASASYCQNGIDPSPVFVAGASAGVFSAVPATLAFLSTSTGQIDLSASAAGTYTVTNFIAAAGGCAPSTSTTVVTIDSTTILTDPADQVRCNNVATVAVNFVSTVVPTTYTWTHNATAAIGIATSGSGNIPSFIPVNTGTTHQFW
ncbi:mucin-22 [Filimonas sp.]|nr:mucin-22 [Filimonas sp.]